MFLNWLMNDQRGQFDLSKLAGRVLLFVAILTLWSLLLTPAKGSEPPTAWSDDPPIAYVSATVIPSDPVAACVRVQWKNYGGSGTCIACEGGKSLVLSCNHVFSEGGLGNYPLDCVVQHDGKTYTAVAVSGDREADLAAVVVEGELPVAEIATQAPAVGAFVWHRGIGSGGGRGRVVLVPSPGRGGSWVESSCHFAADMTSISGDSGAGVFNQYGQLVAVHNGRFGAAGDFARGAPLMPVRNFLRGAARTMFPGLTARLSTGGTMFVLPDPPIARPMAELPKAEPVRVGDCPGGVCPAPSYSAPRSTGWYPGRLLGR